MSSSKLDGRKQVALHRLAPEQARGDEQQPLERFNGAAKMLTEENDSRAAHGTQPLDAAPEGEAGGYGRPRYQKSRVRRSLGGQAALVKDGESEGSGTGPRGMEQRDPQRWTT